MAIKTRMTAKEWRDYEKEHLEEPSWITSLLECKNQFIRITNELRFMKQMLLDLNDRMEELESIKSPEKQIDVLHDSLVSLTKTVNGYEETIGEMDAKLDAEKDEIEKMRLRIDNLEKVE